MGFLYVFLYVFLYEFYTCFYTYLISSQRQFLVLSIEKSFNSHGQRNPYQIGNSCINFCSSIEHYHIAIHCKCIWTLWWWWKNESTSCKTSPIIKVILSKKSSIDMTRKCHLLALYDKLSNLKKRRGWNSLSTHIGRHLTIWDLFLSD